ncbi:MAG: glycosyltransferase family 2 protein [Bacteroidota bacterium]|nr:glycosyltransferase family 2 protein [Bacteroidota bacterium]
MEPFFSIIIPTYNRALLIPKAIDSVLAQTLGDWELIIIDDGSRDDTKEVISIYTDTRIKYVYQQNAERCAARNNGVSQSRGRYICFLDSDDYFLPQRLELLYNELQERNFPVAAFYTGLMFDRDGVLKELTTNHYDPTRVFDSIALSVIHSQQVCIYHSIWQEFKYDTAFHIGEDLELWLRIAAKYDFIYLDKQATVVVVEHDEQSVNLQANNVYIDQLRVLNHIFSDGHPGNKISPKVKARLYSICYYGMTRYFIQRGERWPAAAKLAHAILAQPNTSYFKFQMNVFLKLISFAPMEKIKELTRF